MPTLARSRWKSNAHISSMLGENSSFVLGYLGSATDLTFLAGQVADPREGPVKGRAQATLWPPLFSLCTSDSAVERVVLKGHHIKSGSMVHYHRLSTASHSKALLFVVGRPRP